MISFDEIDKHSRLYDFLMHYLSFVHNHIYYKKFYVINPENIPPRGTPVLVIANHQNGMMDAMAILHTLCRDGRQPVFIARGDIFKKDAVAKILRFLKILPVFRTRDGNRDDIMKDLEIFNLAAKVLTNGSTLAIFPEAGHQQGHFMNTFKKGFPRIAFAAEEMNDFNLGLQILPLNIHYSNYFDFRSELMVTCGKPFTCKEYFELYKESPNQAYLELNNKSRNLVKKMTPDIDIPEYYNEINTLTEIARTPLLKQKCLKPNFLPDMKNADMEIIEKVRKLKSDKEDDFQQLMLDTQNYLSQLKQLKITDFVVNKNFSSIKIVAQTLAAVLTLPVALFGFVNNFVPAFITKYFTQKIKDPMFRSTFNYAIGGYGAFPVWYIFLLILTSVLSKSFLFGLIYLLMTMLSGLFNVSYKRGIAKLATIFRTHKLQRTEQYSELCDLKRKILSNVECRM